MIVTTLCLCIQHQALLLATKQRGFGAGKLNASGGKVREGEPLRRATIRELKEEYGLKARQRDLRYAAVLHFYFDEKLLVTCHVFTLNRWQGEPKDTDEMAGFEWHHHENLPEKRMWAGDKHWLPYVFRGEHIEASIMFNADGTLVKEFKPKAVLLKE
jgi:8-oxo-dGTP diphosphatase